VLNISDELKNLCKDEKTPRAETAYFPAINKTLSEEILEDSPNLQDSLFEGGEIRFGACVAVKKEFILINISEDITGLEFANNHIVNGSLIPLGIFNVDECKKQDDTEFKDVVAYDRMKAFDIDAATWYNSLFPVGTETYTLTAFRNSFLAYVGLTEDTSKLPLPNDNMTVIKTIEPSQISGRDVIEVIEEINGCFGHITRDGKFGHIVLQPAYGLYPANDLYPADDLYPVSETDTSYTMDGSIAEVITPEMTETVRFEEYTVKEIDKLIIRQEENDVGAIVGTGTNAYVIEDNFLVYGKSAAELETIAINAFGNMAKRPYRPFESTNIGLPYLEVGDMIKFDRDEPIISYVLQRNFKGIQALQDEFTAQGAKELKQNFGINKQIIQLERKATKIKKDVDGVRVEVEDLASSTNTKFEQTDEKISLEATRAINTENALQGSITVLAGEVELKVDANGIVQAINLSPEGAKINVTKLDINGIVTANGNFKILLDGSMEAVNGKFSGTLISPIINGGSINSTSFTQTGQYGTVNIAEGQITADAVQVLALVASQTIYVGANITINSSGGIAATTLNATYVNCTLLNGYTPITSSNVYDQRVYSAASADTAGSAISADTAEFAYSANYAESAGSAPLSNNWSYAIKTNVAFLASQLGVTLPASWPS
jgi:hypothetical protein